MSLGVYCPCLLINLINLQSIETLITVFENDHEMKMYFNLNENPFLTKIRPFQSVVMNPTNDYSAVAVIDAKDTRETY